MEIIDFLEIHHIKRMEQVSLHFRNILMKNHREWTKRSVLKEDGINAKW
jgi:hypothetical protein